MGLNPPMLKNFWYAQASLPPVVTHFGAYHRPPGGHYLPGTISAVSHVALLSLPSRTMESGWEGGVQAVCKVLAILSLWRWLWSIIGMRHLILWRWVQLLSPATQEMQESTDFTYPYPYPPQTTSLPPDRRERLWWDLGWGRSGMEQVLEGGRGNSLILESWLSPPSPPTTTCPDADI